MRDTRGRSLWLRLQLLVHSIETRAYSLLLSLSLPCLPPHPHAQFIIIDGFGIFGLDGAEVGVSFEDGRAARLFVLAPTPVGDISEWEIVSKFQGTERETDNGAEQVDDRPCLCLLNTQASA